jgi:hypothetical protein
VKNLKSKISCQTPFKLILTYSTFMLSLDHCFSLQISLFLKTFNCQVYAGGGKLFEMHCLHIFAMQIFKDSYKIAIFIFIRI